MCLFCSVVWWLLACTYLPLHLAGLDGVGAGEAEDVREGEGTVAQPPDLGEEAAVAL